VTFRSLLRNLIASRSGQLAFDFRLDAQPAKVLQLKRREPPPMVALMDPVAQPSRPTPRSSSSGRRFSTTGTRPTSTKPQSPTGGRWKSIPTSCPR
jgi:hypothetical protein